MLAHSWRTPNRIFHGPGHSLGTTYPGLWPEIHVYEGQVVDGHYNGKGRATFTAGFKYEVRPGHARGIPASATLHPARAIVLVARHRGAFPLGDGAMCGIASSGVLVVLCVWGEGVERSGGCTDEARRSRRTLPTVASARLGCVPRAL